VLEPVIARYRDAVKRLDFRADAAFANPDEYEFLEAEGIGSAIRLPASRVLQDEIGYLLNLPVGRPPHELRRCYASLGYRAGSSGKPRRVMAKVEWHPGELYPRVGFILTNLAAERVRTFYNQRGIAEQWIKRGRARSSGPGYRAARLRRTPSAFSSMPSGEFRVFVRATTWGISAEKSFARGSARSKATVPVVCPQAAFNNTVNRGHRERVLP
jgi:hypothetical protein